MGGKAQGIDLDKLKPPLKAFPDDTAHGGTPGHVAIVPVDENGAVDLERLKAWALSRDTNQTHELTQLLLDAVVELNAKGGI